MGFAIIRQEKIRNADSFNSREAHNSREILTSNVELKYSHKNITLIKNKYKNYDDFVEQKREEIRKSNKLNNTKHRFVRSVLNKKTKEKELSSMFQEFVFTHSKDALSEEDSIEYLKAANKFIKDRFHDCEIISSEIHLDETTPHIHIVSSYYNDIECRFMQKELSKEKITDINEIRKAFQHEVADKFELKMQDGSVVEAKNHQRSANKEIAELKEAQKLKDQELLDLKNLHKNKIRQLESENVSKTEALQALTATNDTLIQENEAYKQSIVDKQNQLERGNEIYQDMQNEIYELENTNKTLQEQNEALNEQVIDLEIKNASQPIPAPTKTKYSEEEQEILRKFANDEKSEDQLEIEKLRKELNSENSTVQDNLRIK